MLKKTASFIALLLLTTGVGAGAQIASPSPEYTGTDRIEAESPYYVVI